MRASLRLGVLLLALAAAACVPPVPDNDVFVEFDEETTMGEIQAAGELVVALPDDVGDPWVDFATPVAEDIADALRVDVVIRSRPNEELLDMVAGGAADIAFPVLTVTEDLVREHAFSDPIYIGHQRLVVPTGSGVESVGDLEGEVCSPVDPAIGVELHELKPGLGTLPLEPGDALGCVELLDDGLAGSATAPDVLLATILDELGSGFEIVGDQLTTEPLAAVVERGAPAWVDYVNKIITEFDQEGRWAASYEEHLGPLLGGETPDPPNMTLEEAAALFPADLADPAED